MNHLNIDVRPLDDAGKRERLCRTITDALPEWFGIEKHNVQYAKDAAAMEELVATADGDPIGFLVHKTETDPHLGLCVVNVHWLGVLPTLHRKGAGSALMRAVFDLARAQGLSTVTLGTIDPTMNDESYLRNLSFYGEHGFQIYRHFHYQPETSWCFCGVPSSHCQERLIVEPKQPVVGHEAGVLNGLLRPDIGNIAAANRAQVPRQALGF